MTKYQNKQTCREKRMAIKRWIVSTSFKTGLMGMIAVFGVLYIMQMSSVSTKGFAISDLQKQVQTLENETRSLEVEISQYRSMGSIQERLKNMDLVAVGEIEYVTPVGTVVARR
jgi:cell division protein FtsB